MILNICDNSNILKAVRFVRIAITVIKIAVPILLMLSIAIEYTIAVSKDDSDLLAKANKNVIRKIIAAIAVFMVPTVVGLALKLSNPEPNTPFACLRDATMSTITVKATAEAKEALNQARDTLNRSDYNYAYQLIGDVPESSEKTALENELKEIDSYIKIKEAISALKIKYDDNLYKQITKSIEKVKDKTVQDKLYKLLEEAGKGRPLDTQPGTHSATAGNLTYYVNVPESATTNMPLIMYLHGDGGDSGAPNSPLYSAAKKHFGNNFPFIIVAPAGGMWAETNGRLANLKTIIDTVCQQYSCDTSKISITGHSRGSIGTWHMVNSYPNFFFAAVPVSCGSYSINPQNFLGTKVRAYAGTSGEAEQRYNREMSNNVKRIKAAGGNATFTSLSGHNHGSSIGAAYTQDTLLFMIQ